MMISFRILVVLAAIFMLSVGGAEGQSSMVPQSQQPAIVAKNPFSIVISAPNQATKLGSPILIKMKITNTTDHDVIFPVERLEYLGALLHIVVRDSQGKEASFRNPPAPLSNPPKAEELPMGSVRGIFLRPGQSDVSNIDLFETFNLDRPGKYSVQAKHSCCHDKTWVTSNKITVTVTP